MFQTFTGNYAFLSNDYPAKIEFMDLEFTCATAAYLAATCLYPQDIGRFYGKNADEAKRLSRLLEKKKLETSEKLALMDKILRIKFQLPKLKRKLKAIQDPTIVYWNYGRDLFWGNTPNFNGKNHLGILLTQIRDELKQR